MTSTWKKAPEAKVVSQQIIDGGGKKAGYITADFYNEAGPITKLEPPSQELYEKKIDFERSRLAEWLL
jgi:hypothetical protein